ncbi:MAG: haloalkane dehalogenase [Deltaproteobacteria bacterium]|nr:haloalkane dehalogenase [Deltaproteobacteria bacterium]
MAVLRTPESRFANLPDYPFAPHYLDLAKAVGRSGEARMHYLDEGRGNPILCLHGEPSWSFLYRRMIPILKTRGRVLAPDLFGFGKSDKFTERADYSYAMHHDAILGFIEALDLRDITLVCQDWGGLIGLQIAGQHPERFARLVVMNTALPTGEEEVGPGFLAWREYVANTPDLAIGPLFGRAIFPEDRRTPEILAAYDAPYPDRSYKEGAQAFPSLVPITPDAPGAAENREAWRTLERWSKPCLVMAGDKDIVLGIPAGRTFEKRIPTAGKLVVIENAGHFLQEDKGEEVAERIVAWLDG